MLVIVKWGFLFIMLPEKLKGTSSQLMEHDCASHCVRFISHAQNLGNGCLSILVV